MLLFSEREGEELDMIKVTGSASIEEAHRMEFGLAEDVKSYLLIVQAFK